MNFIINNMCVSGQTHPIPTHFRATLQLVKLNPWQGRLRTHTHLFFLLFVLPDARFFATSSSTYYSDKRQIAANQFWHFWYNQTLFSNRPNDNWSSYYPRFESPPTVGWSYRTDSQFSVEESVATPVYVQTNGKDQSKLRQGIDKKNSIFALAP